MSIGVGYYQRPKAQVQACQPAVPISQLVSQPTTSQTLPAIPVAAPVEEKTEAPTESPPVMEVPPVDVTPVAEVAPPVPRKLRLNRIQGVGEKRVAQLKALGINNLNELAKASADEIAKNLQISPKMTKRWIATAEELTK
jgi:predicted flap endonuclease-1-like 5' DNA nuclease